MPRLAFFCRRLSDLSPVNVMSVVPFRYAALPPPHGHRPAEDAIGSVSARPRKRIPSLESQTGGATVRVADLFVRVGSRESQQREQHTLAGRGHGGAISSASVRVKALPGLASAGSARWRRSVCRGTSVSISLSAGFLRGTAAASLWSTARDREDTAMRPQRLSPGRSCRGDTMPRGVTPRSALAPPAGPRPCPRDVRPR